MNPVNCYICDNTSVFYCKNIFKLKSKHSETPICDFICKFLGQELTRLPSNDVDNVVCAECLNKIDEYDFACMTVERVEKELRDVLLHTESVYAVDKVFVDDTDFDDVAKEEEKSDEVNTSDNKTNIIFKCTICQLVFER